MRIAMLSVKTYAVQLIWFFAELQSWESKNGVARFVDSQRAAAAGPSASAGTKWFIASIVVRNEYHIFFSSISCLDLSLSIRCY
jgi:hypothetical protein